MIVVAAEWDGVGGLVWSGFVLGFFLLLISSHPLLALQQFFDGVIDMEKFNCMVFGLGSASVAY